LKNAGDQESNNWNILRGRTGQLSTPPDMLGDTKAQQNLLPPENKGIVFSDPNV